MSASKPNVQAFYHLDWSFFGSILPRLLCVQEIDVADQRIEKNNSVMHRKKYYEKVHGSVNNFV